MDQFDKHLEQLYEAYGQDTSDIPEADAILSGVTTVTEPLNFDKQQQLANNVVGALIKIWIKYNRKTNILIEDKLIRFFDFLTILEPELQIVMIRKLLDEGIDLVKYDYFKLLNEEFGEFLT